VRPGVAGFMCRSIGASAGLAGVAWTSRGYWLSSMTIATDFRAGKGAVRGAYWQARMRWHAIFMIAAGTMIALSVFFALRPHPDDKGIRSPNAGLIDRQCDASPDSSLIPAEHACEKP
jgi:hypothetical protein